MSGDTSVTVSERAARRIGEILQGEPAGTMLRVSVEGGGCSGFQYKFDMERAKADDDLVIARDGATVLIDPVSVQYLSIASRSAISRRSCMAQPMPGESSFGSKATAKQPFGKLSNSLQRSAAFGAGL